MVVEVEMTQHSVYLFDENDVLVLIQLQVLIDHEQVDDDENERNIFLLMDYYCVEMIDHLELYYMFDKEAEEEDH